MVYPEKTKSKVISPIVHLIIITTLTVFLISTGSFNSVDTLNRLQVTRSLWTNSPQVVEINQNTGSPADVTGFSAIGRNGKRYVTWGIGQSLVMLPADIIAQSLVETLKIQSQSIDKLVNGIVSYLTFPLINILAIIVSFQFLKKLEFNVKQAVIGSLSLLFCTSFLHYSQTHQENSLDFLMTISGYLFHLLWLTSNSTLYLCLGIAALGFNVLVRLTLLVNGISVGIFTGIYLYLQTKVKIIDNSSIKQSLIKYLTFAAIIYGFFLGIDRLYHWMRFDSFSGSYTGIWAEQIKLANPSFPKSFPFSNPFQEGLLGFLFSPERSIFLFNPLILVTIYLLIKNWKDISYNIRAFLLSSIFLLIAIMVTYSTWFLWGGGGSWGSRYTTTASQLISLLAVPLAMKFNFKSSIEKLCFKAIILISFFIQISSVIFDFNLELAQGLSLKKTVFVVGQRFLNIIAVTTGNFDNWGLRPINTSIIESQRFITISFLPWKNASNFLPANLTSVLQIIWIILLLVLIYTTFSLVKNVSAEQDNLNKLS